MQFQEFEKIPQLLSKINKIEKHIPIFKNKNEELIIEKYFLQINQ